MFQLSKWKIDYMHRLEQCGRLWCSVVRSSTFIAGTYPYSVPAIPLMFIRTATDEIFYVYQKVNDGFWGRYDIEWRG